MIARRLVPISALALLLNSGCSANPPVATIAPLASTQPAPTTRPVAPKITEAGNSPEAVARRTEEYARNVQEMLAKRQTEMTPSPVRWLEPSTSQPSTSVAGAEAPRSADLSVDTPAPAPTPAPVAMALPKAPALVKMEPEAPVVAPAAREVPVVTQSPLAVAPAPVVAPGEALEQKLAQRVKDSPRDLASQLDYQLLLLVRDEQVPQMSALATMSPEDRELLTAVLDGLSNFRNTAKAEGNMLAARKSRPIVEMGDRVRSQGDLTIPTLSLCSRVDGFGVYEPIEPARFLAGKDHPAIIYCEVGNFASHFGEQKLWHTQLRQEVVLYTELGLAVWQDKPKTFVDQSRNRRHDFYLIRTIRLPSALTIGRYLLKVTVVDQQANHVAEGTVPIQIVAQ